jgi:hypothetical protein
MQIGWGFQVATPWKVAIPRFFKTSSLRKLVKGYILFFINLWKKWKFGEKIKPLGLWVEGNTSNHASFFSLEKVVQER